MKTRARVAVAMSGGVDSSAAAAILMEQGYDVIGFSMQLWDQTRGEPVEGHTRTGRCCALDDLYDAKLVAARLAIPHYVVNFQQEFERKVVRSFVEDYRDGFTPSPCVLCNSRMKFQSLLLLAENVKAGYVATGHYARVSQDEQSGRYLLGKGRDPDKDQSYFLFELNQAQLARAMFPVGELDKAQVREIARRYGLEVADKQESQEICFVSDGDYAGFVERYLQERGRSAELQGGQVVDSAGRVVGSHRGVHRYTVGQRRGLGIAHSAPLYVLELKPAERQVVVGDRSQLARSCFFAERMNWIAIPEPVRPFLAAVKIRSRHTEAPATVIPISRDRVQVEFQTPQMAVTPGQAAVFYQGDRVIGGGWIQRSP